MDTRKAYTRVEDIPSAILIDLEAGRIESKTLAEITAIDLKKLLLNNLEALRKEDFELFDQCKGILRKMRASANMVLSVYGEQHHEVMRSFNTSDTLRGIGAFMIGLSDTNSPAIQIEKILAYASDDHFGVREWAWMALRSQIVEDFNSYYPYLLKLSKDNDPKLRRFSVESIRPKGVWAAHLNILKLNPSLAYEILHNLHNDSDRYVQDSVANWLNDLSKDNPDWIRKTCGLWESDINKGEKNNLDYVIRRATRNIGN